MNVLNDSAASPFVDLYSILGVAPDILMPDLRRRIALLYTEAQDSLEHRSFRKRFYYHELYEVHLPHAHHVLLNEKRRAAYNAERVIALRDRAPQTAADGAPFNRQTATSTAERRAASRADSLSYANLPTLEHQRPEYHETIARDLNVERKPSAPPPEWARMDRATVERRRDSNRRELIKQELQLAGRRAGGGTGALGLAVATGLWLAGDALGFSLALLGIIFLTVLGASFFVARLASRGARRNIVATLSQMPYEALLRRSGS